MILDSTRIQIETRVRPRKKLSKNIDMFIVCATWMAQSCQSGTNSDFSYLKSLAIDFAAKKTDRHRYQYNAIGIGLKF